MKKILLLILTIILSINLVNASVEDYDFTIEFDHNFDEDEEIECTIYYDDRDKVLELDENSNSDDLIYSNDFEENLSLECEDIIDEISILILDRYEEELYDEELDDISEFEFELDLVDEEDEWFEIIFNHDFNTDEIIECEIEVDSKRYDFEISENKNTYSRNYINTFEVECEDEIDEIILNIYDDEENLLKKINFEDEDIFDFDDEELIEKHEIRIDFNDDFEDKIECRIYFDGELETTFELNEDSSGSDLRYVGDFEVEVEVECDERVENIEFRIYDSNGDKISEKLYEDVKNIEYNFEEGDYGFYLIVNDDFLPGDEINKCEIYLDLVLFDEVEFDYDSSAFDKTIKNTFNENLEFSCENELEDVTLIVYDIEEDEDIIDTNYKNIKSINFPETEVIIEEIVEINDEKNQSIQEEEEEIIVEEVIEDVSLNLSSSTNEGSLNNQVEVITNEVEKEEVQEEVKQEEIVSSEEGNSPSKSFLIIIIIALIIFSLIYLSREDLISYYKKENKSHKKLKKRNEKKDIDFSFLNKKK